jgi:hypothetical protein
MPPTIPVVPGANANILSAAINRAWAQFGIGTFEFWSIFNDFIFRDTTATAVAPGGIQALDGFYPIFVNDGLQYSPKGRFEKWDVQENTAVAMVGPIRAERYDSPAQPVEMREGEDPTGMIRQIIQGSLKLWGDFLPMQLFIDMLVNGRWGTRTLTTYDGLSLFNALHRVNTTTKDPRLAALTLSNILQLPGAVDESAFTKALTKLQRQPDFNGKILPNAMGLGTVLILCPSEQVMVRWAHVLGAPGMVINQLIQQGQNAGISSVIVGRAQLVVVPYLVTMADSTVGFDPEKRSYMFARTPGRKPFIVREEQPPRVRQTTGTDKWAHEQNAILYYARAYVGVGLGEYRGILAIDEK